VAAALGYFLVASQQSDLVRGRAQTLTTTVLSGQDESFQWRLNTWHAALTMLHRKPIFGWGVGSYPLYEQRFTHQGDTEDAVLAGAAHIGDETHDSYLQLAVELGVPGLLLWLLTLTSAFWNGVRALPSLPTGSVGQWVLIGGLSALAGQAIDALADPAWQFGEVAASLWVVLGLVVAESGPPDAAVGASKARLPIQITLSVASIWILVKLIAYAQYLPIPDL
jgi:O-antigen ligase